MPNPDYREDYENVSYITLIASLTDKQIKRFRNIGPSRFKFALAIRDAAKAKIESYKWFENNTRPVIITLCGSESKAELFDAAEEYLQEFFYYQHGAVVMRPVPLKIRRNMKIETHHEVHDLKMKQSDAVIIVDGLTEKGSYFGRDTQREIAFAKKNKIPVYFFHKVLMNGFRE